MTVRRSLLLLCLLVLGVGTALHGAEASGTGVALLSAETGVYINYFLPTTNFNGQELVFQEEIVKTVDGYCSLLTKNIYVRFDLTDITFPVDKARLRLRPQALGLDNDIPFLATYGDAWDAATVTWDNNTPVPQPPILMFTDYGIFPLTDDFFWTDHLLGSGGGPTLAEVVAAEQAANGGDNQLTLSFIVPLPPGCSVNGDDPDEDGGIFFWGVNDFAPPTLDLADAANELPDPIPAAVTVRQMEATSTTDAAATVVSGALLLGLSAFGTAAARRKLDIER